MRRFPRLIALLASAATAACAACAEPPKGKPVSPVATPSRKPEPVAGSPQADRPTTGEVPADLIQKMRADLAAQAGSDARAARIVSSESVVWPSGALGCAKPGEIYTQALVPGYRVQFEVGGRTFTYHASARGFFKLCQNALEPPRSPAK
jgi:hypothetical protein